MTRTWFSSSRERLRRGVPAALAVMVSTVAVPAPVSAATVLSRAVELAFADDGSFSERVSMRVRLDDAAELSDWSPWVIPLDRNRVLTAVSATAWRPDGSVVILGEDDMTSVEGAGGGGILHSSAAARLLEFPPLPAGSRLQVTWEVREEPWIESTSIPLLAGDAPIEELVVAVSGAGPKLRWRIDPTTPEGEEPRFQVTESPGGVRVSASDLAPETGDRPVLRVAWGDGAAWSDVGRWYDRLVRELPRRPPAVEGLARELVAGETDARTRVSILLDYVRRRIRYVAVEVGVGGYRPSPPGEVLERRWGDCKDKAFLLLDLLAEAGIEAYPTLVLADEERRLDDRFPGADQFNHLIVAVPVSAVSPHPDDVASERYLFLDATQETGGLTWLHPALQGQTVLVVRGADSELDVIPVLAERELRDLAVELSVGEAGDATGRAVYRITGHGAWALAGATASASPEDLGALARRILSAVLPGGVLGAPRWRQGDDDGVPVVELSVPIRFEHLVEGRQVRSLALPETGAFPPPSELDQEAPEVRSLRPGLRHAVWDLDLPAGWCPPETTDDALANDVGSVRQVVTAGPEGVRVERRSEVSRRWIGPDLVAAARDLALAESRTARRRLRLRCPNEP